jgi:WD40 repeat protein
MHRRECGLPSTSEFSCLTVAAGKRLLGPVDAADFSPNGRRVATAGDRGTAFVFDTVSGRQIAVLRGHYLRVDDIAFSPDGHRIITAAEDGTARLWDAHSGDQLEVLRGHLAVYAATFIPHSRRVATANADGNVWIWGPDGRPQRAFHFKDESGVGDVAASPDGRYLVAPEGDTARVLDDETGRTVTRLRGHDGFVFSAAFSPDGRSLVTGGEDLTARLWEFPSGRPLGVLRGHTGYLDSVAFAPDGDSVVTGGVDGTARIFPCDVCGSVDALLSRAHERVTRPLSREERARFLTFGG